MAQGQATKKPNLFRKVVEGPKPFLAEPILAATQPN